MRTQHSRTFSLITNSRRIQCGPVALTCKTEGRGQFYDALEIRNVYHSRYVRIDGTVLEGGSVSSLAGAADAVIDAELNATLDTTELKILERDHKADEALTIGAVDALVGQARPIEHTVAALGAETIKFEGSNSLDDPETVFQ